jgi:hypothetical protein
MNQNHTPSLEGLIAVLADIVRDQKKAELENKQKEYDSKRPTTQAS